MNGFFGEPLISRFSARRSRPYLRSILIHHAKSDGVFSMEPKPGYCRVQLLFISLRTFAKFVAPLRKQYTQFERTPLLGKDTGHGPRAAGPSSCSRHRDLRRIQIEAYRHVLLHIQRHLDLHFWLGLVSLSASRRDVVRRMQHTRDARHSPRCAWWAATRWSSVDNAVADEHGVGLERMIVSGQIYLSERFPASVGACCTDRRY